MAPFLYLVGARQLGGYERTTLWPGAADLSATDLGRLLSPLRPTSLYLVGGRHLTTTSIRSVPLGGRGIVTYVGRLNDFRDKFRGSCRGVVRCTYENIRTRTTPVKRSRDARLVFLTTTETCCTVYVARRASSSFASFATKSMAVTNVTDGDTHTGRVLSLTGRNTTTCLGSSNFTFIRI